jgi:hypothetical protein
MKVAYERIGYLSERLVAIGKMVDALDLDEKVPRYTSSGYCDPIVESGTTLRYRVIEVECPEWLIRGVARGQRDGRWYGCGTPEEVAVKLLIGETGCRDLERQLKRLVALENKRGQALKNKWSEVGII